MSDQARLAEIEEWCDRQVFTTETERRAIAKAREVLAALREAERRAEEAEKNVEMWSRLAHENAHRGDDAERQLAEASRTISSLQAALASEREAT